MFVRTAGDPSALLPSLRSALRAVEPGLMLRGVQPFDAVVQESVQVTRLALWLLSLFAVTALALAAVGIYGVMSYTVRHRMRELGTRVALGATPGSILRLVLVQGARMTIIGAAIGLVASFAAGRALASMLFDTAPADPIVLGGAAVSLALTALLACYLPARRAARVDPVETLTLPS